MKTNLMVLGFCMMFVCSSLHAQWNAATDVLVHTEALDSTKTSSLMNVISDKNGGAWVLWNQTYTSYYRDSTRIYVQHLDSNGYATLDSNGLELNDTGALQVFGDALALDDGSLRIGYWIKNDTSYETPVFLQNISSTGEKLFGNRGIHLKDYSTRYHQGLRYNGMFASNDNSFCVLYTANGIPSPGIYLQKIDKNGALLFGDTGRLIRASELTSDSHFSPSYGTVHSDGKGGAFITFTNLSLPDDSLWMQWINNDGSFHFSNRGIVLCRIQHGLIPSAINSITVQTYGNGFIFYPRFNLSQPFSGGKNLSIFTYDSLGHHLNGENGVAIFSDTDGLSILPSFFPNDDGSVVYFYRKGDNNYSPVYMRKVSADGTDLWGGGKPVSEIDSTNIGAISITTGNYGYMAIWDTGMTTTKLRAQLYDFNGNARWNTKNVIIGSGQSGYRYGPYQTRDQFGNCIACWNDNRNLSYPHSEIYCAKIDTMGFLPTVISRSVHIVDQKNAAIQLYPNPAQNYLYYSVVSQFDGMQIQINDALGRNIWNGNDAKGKIDVRSFGKGMYIMTVNTKEGMQSIPFVIY